MAATVTLAGPNSSIPSIANLASVAGNFVLSGGASFANTGRINLGATSMPDVSGNYTQSSTGKLTLQMVDSSIGRVRTLGTPTLGGALEVSLTGTPAAIGTTLTILENQSANAVNGIFAGLPQNSIFSFGGMTWRLRYTLGNGNDVALTRLS